jgi:hypothetical protein
MNGFKACARAGWRFIHNFPENDRFPKWCLNVRAEKSSCLISAHLVCSGDLRKLP